MEILRNFASEKTTKMLRLQVLLWLLLSSATNMLASGGKEEGNYCLGFYNGKSGDKHPPRDNMYEFSACKEHERRTCCKKNHSEAISRLFVILKAKTSLSNECLHYYQKSICSYCDGEVGNGNKISQRSPIICADYCRHWYSSCRMDYFDNSHNSYVLDNDDISFIKFNFVPCSDHSVICSPLHSITNDPSEFCQLNGFSVYPDANDDPHSHSVSEYNPNCFDGVPSVAFHGAGVKKPRAYKRTAAFYESKGRHAAPKSFFDDIKKSYNNFVRHIHVPLPALIFVTLVIAWAVNRIVTFIWGFSESFAAD